MKARHADPGDLKGLEELATRVFRGPGSKPTMGEMFRHLFCEENAQNIALAEVNGRIVSMIGMVLSTVAIGSARLKVASMGAVCTDPEYRMQGHAGACLDLTLDTCKRLGVHLLWVSGDRSLYRRNGCRPAGAYAWVGVSKEDAWPELCDLEMDTSPARELGGMHALEAVRFVRSPSEYETLMQSWRSGATDRQNLARGIGLIRKAGVAVASVAYTFAVREGERKIAISEMAGDRLHAARGVLTLAAKLNAARLDVQLPAHEVHFAELLELVGGVSPSVRFGTSHTFAVVDEASTLAVLQPYFEETGVEAPPIPDENDDVKRRAALTEDLFAPENGGNARVPLPCSGLNYV